MKIQASLNQLYRPILFALLLVFICCSCGGATATGSTGTKTVPTIHTQPAQAAQPVSAAQLLSGGPVTYVALGASDAVGVGSSKPATQGYVPLIEQRLPKGS